MIDKPKGKTEMFIDRGFQWLKDQIKVLDNKTKEPRETVSTFKGKHPRIAKTIVVTVCLLTVGLVIVGFATPKEVTVRIDDSIEVTETTYETTSRRVDTFIENHEIDFVYGQDIIDAELYSGISNGMVINIQKAVQVPVTADGETQLVTTLPVTVEELLKELDIHVGENDIVEPALDQKIAQGDELFVRRVTMEYVVEESTTPFNESYVADSSVIIGDLEVIQEGAVGTQKDTYLVVYIDGEEATRTLYQSEIVQDKQDRVVAYGTNMTFGSIPAGLQYKTKISGVKAVSYYYSGNPRGAYGLPCTYGTCAVDRNVIPLGSLLYVEGYGYAIANDVGTAIKGNIIDLYMEHPNQCSRWGARFVDVYVIR